MSKVITMQGATVPMATNITVGVDWKLIVGVIVGTGALAGGSFMAYRGNKRDSKGMLYGGIGLGVAGLAGLAYSLWKLSSASPALLPIPAATQPASGATNGADGQTVLLGDGRPAVIERSQRLLDGTVQYTARVLSKDGRPTSEEVTIDA
jgi:hypothetical protein